MVYSLLLALFLFVNLVRGLDYYLSSSNGNDAWSGLLPEPNSDNTDGPKATISAFTSLLRDSPAGNNFYFRRGDVWDADGTTYLHLLILSKYHPRHITLLN